MNILLITFSKHTDFQDAITVLAKELESEYNVWIVCSDDGDYIPDKSLKLHLIRVPGVPGINKSTFDFKTIISLCNWIRKNKFDVIYYESIHIWNLLIMLSCRNSIHYSSIHDITPHKGDKNTAFIKIFYRFVNYLSDYIVLRNEKYIKYFCKVYHCKRKRVYYIPLWRKFPLFSEPTYSKMMLFFGRINPYKGINNLYKIACTCQNVQFSIVGRIEPGMETIVNKLSELSNVTLDTQYIPYKKVKSYFNSADCLVLPYQTATQSGVIKDAYRFSRPVIAFNVGALSEQVNNGVSGFLIDEGNIQQFAECVEKVVNMSNYELKNLCINAYDFGKSINSVESAASIFSAMLKATTNKSGVCNS